jgi:hypothetical protein
MKLYGFLLALPLAILLTGCSPVDSLNPLYTDKDVVFDPTLLGQWGSENDGLNFAKLGDNAYRIVMSGKDDDTGQITSMVLDAHLVQLQGHRFLDVVWRESAAGMGDTTLPEVRVTQTKFGQQVEPRLIKAGMGAYIEVLPGESAGGVDRFTLRRREAHEFFKVVMEDEGRTLKLIQLDDSWIEHQIRDGKLVVDHEAAEGNSTVLTAATAELQRLVLDHVNDEEAFHGDTTMDRMDGNLK